MKIAVSASGQSLDAEVDPRFGRCQYFIIADPDTMEFEAVDNSSAAEAGGAGVSAAQAIVERRVQAVLTGSCGPNAHQVLSPAGIQVVTGVSGKVKGAIEDYRTGKFQATAQANVPDHFGMGKGMRTGRGTGRGMGMGRGMGKGMSMSRGITPLTSPAPKSQSREQELELLKIQSQAMMQQLDDIQHRIDELDKK
jgi:predicted Fe-Mo cluster-binding NifX family protein